MATGTVNQKQDFYVELDETGRGLQESCRDAHRESGYVFPAFIRSEPDLYLFHAKPEVCGVEPQHAAAAGCDDLRSPYTTVQSKGSFDVADEAGVLTEADVRRMRAVYEHEVSNNTRANYRAQWRRFTDWARSRGTDALLADPVQVAAYLAERMELHKHKPATLRAAAAAIGFIHSSSRLDNPCDTKDVKKTLSGATRKAGSQQSQAEGLTDRALEAVRATAYIPRRSRGGNFESAETARRRGQVDTAMISLMRDALLRVSEASALRWEDLTAAEDGTGRLIIRRSKTDTHGEGVVVFAVSPPVLIQISL